MTEIPNIPKRLPKAGVSLTSYVIGPCPGGYVLRDWRGREVSPVLSTAALLKRWCLHNGYKTKGSKTLIFIKDNGRARRKKQSNVTDEL